MVTILLEFIVDPKLSFKPLIFSVYNNSEHTLTVHKITWIQMMLLRKFLHPTLCCESALSWPEW